MQHGELFTINIDFVECMLPLQFLYMGNPGHK